MLGTIGESDRMESTVISDAVNLAARIETLTKEYQISVLISAETFAELKNPKAYRLRYIDMVKVKGKEKFTKIYEVFDADNEEQITKKIDSLKAFEAAVEDYHTGKYLTAFGQFNEIYQINPEDRVAELYLQRCERKDR